MEYRVRSKSGSIETIDVKTEPNPLELNSVISECRIINFGKAATVLAKTNASLKYIFIGTYILNDTGFFTAGDFIGISVPKAREVLNSGIGDSVRKALASV